MVEMPARRISLTSRSCRVPLARSTRPLAWGALAQMMSMFSWSSARPNWVMPSPPAASLRLTRNTPVLVRVERHRLAVALQVGPRGLEVVEGRLGRHKAQGTETARRVVDEHQERARWAAVLEPPMLGAVDLHELAYAVPAIARLVHGLEPLLAVAPETVSQHPLPKRLDPEMDAVSLSQLLAGQRRAEVGVVGLDQGQDLGPQRRRIATIAGLGAACRDQRRRPALPIRLGQPEHGTTRQPHQLGSLTRRNPASRHVPEDMHAVDLSAAHRNHRHQSRAPNSHQARRGTSETGTRVTSLSGVYMVSAHKPHYGTAKL